MTGGELLDGALASEITLVGHTSEGEHGKTTVLQLFDLELVKKLLVIRSDVQRVPSEVTRAFELGLNGSAEHLHSTNRNNDLSERDRRSLVDDTEGLESVGLLENRVGQTSTKTLHDYTKSGKHAHTAVLQLSSTIPSQSFVISLAKVKRIEEADLSGSANIVINAHLYSSTEQTKGKKAKEVNPQPGKTQ